MKVFSGWSIVWIVDSLGNDGRPLYQPFPRLFPLQSGNLRYSKLSCVCNYPWSFQDKLASLSLSIFMKSRLDLCHITFAHHETVMHERILGIKFPRRNPAGSEGYYVYILRFCNPEDYSIKFFMRGAFMIGFPFGTWERKYRVP